MGAGRDLVEVLEAAHPVAPQRAVDDLVPLGQLPGDDVDRGSVQRVAAQLLPDVLAGELAHRHVGPAHLVDHWAVGTPQPMVPSMRYSVMQ